MTDQGFDYTAARRALKERNQVAALEQVKTQTNDPYVKSEIDNRIEEATPLGFGEGWGRTMLGQERGAGDFAPFLSSANQFRQLKRLEAALDRASANRASEDDVNLIRQFYDEQTKPKTFGYDVGRIAAEALPFAGEFFLTRGAFGRLAKAGSAAKQASLLGRARTLMAGMAQPFQRYGRYAKEIATKRPVLGNTLLALGYEAPKQYIGQTVIGETLGGSRTRASAYTNYIANRYGIQAKGDYGVAVRVADDSYGMWTNALPAAVLDNYIELFSEAMGEALVHLPAAIKLTLMGDVGEAARRGAMKEVANNRLLSFLGLSPDPRYTKLWSDFGFQGLVPELGEEFVGAMTRDVVHQVAPQLAEGGNTQHLIENLPAVALGMGLGMFGPASVSSGLARMDYYVATADMDKETLEKVKALKKYAEAEGLQVMGRDLVQIAKIIDAGPTAAGSGALAADEFIRGKWMNSERVRNDALGRIGRRAEQNRERPDTSMEAVEEEMLAMLQEAMSLPFESQSQMGDRSPLLERLKELEIINAEEATDLERRFNARLAKLRKAFDEGKLADVAELAGDTEAKSMLAEMESRGIDTSRQPIGFAAAAWQTRDALKQKLVEGVSRSPEGDIYINTQARDALAALTTREALSPQARRRVGEMDLVGVEEVQEQLAAREALVRELGRSLPEYRFEADLRRPTPALARLQQQAGLAVVQFRGSKGAPVAQWDKENKVLFIDQSKIEAKAEELDMEVDELVGEVVLHEMIHVHVQRLGERGEEWLQELDEVLTQAGFPAESVSDKLNSGLYANLTDMARLEESVAFRVQPFGRMLATQPEQAEAQMPLYRRVFKWVFDELMMWLQPRSFYMKQFLKQRDMLENAGIDISDMSNSQVAIALSTAQHLGEVLQIAQRAEGAVFKSTQEMEKMLGTVEEDIEVVPLTEFIPSVEETLAEDIPSNPALEDVVEQIPVTQEEFNFEQEVPQEDRSEPVAEQQLNAIQGAIETARRAELIPMLEEDLGVPLQREDGKQPRVAQLRRAMLVRLGLLELDGPKLKRLSEAVGADLSAPRAVEPVREEAPQEPAERPAEAVDEEAAPKVAAEGLAQFGLRPAAAPEPAPAPEPEPAAEAAPEPAPEPEAEPAPEPAAAPEAKPEAEPAPAFGQFVEPPLLGRRPSSASKRIAFAREAQTVDAVRAELLREDVNDNLSEVGVKVAGAYDSDTEYRYQLDQIDPDTGRILVGAVQVLPPPAMPRYMLQPERLRRELRQRTVRGETFEVVAIVHGQTVLTTQRLRETDEPGLRSVTILSDELDGTLLVRPSGQKVGSFRISKNQLYDPTTALRLDGQMPLFDIYGNKIPGTEPEGYMPPVDAPLLRVSEARRPLLFKRPEARQEFAARLQRLREEAWLSTANEGRQEDLDASGYLRWVRVMDGSSVANMDLDAPEVGLNLRDEVERVGRAASASAALNAGFEPRGIEPDPKQPPQTRRQRQEKQKRPKLIDPIKQEARAKFWQAIGDMIGVDPALAGELISIRFPKDAEGKVTPKVIWNAEKANKLLRERERAEDAEEGQTLREAALGEAAESGAVVEYMLQPIEDVIGQVFNTGDLSVIDARMSERIMSADSVEWQLLSMLRESFQQVGLLGSEEAVRGTVAAPRTAAQPDAVEPEEFDDEAQTTEMRQLPQYAAAPSEQVMGAISKKDLNAVVGRYLVNVLAASGTIAQNAERQRNMLNSGQLELWPGSPIMRRQSPWWQRFFVLTGGRDSALLSVLSTAAVYTPRPADEMDMPRSRTITNNEALRSSALVRAISLVGSVGSGIVAQGNIQQLPLAAMSSATAESLLSQLFKSSASHAFDDVDLERVGHMLSGDWFALVRTYQGQKGYEALSAWLKQYRETMLRVAAKETNEKTAGTPEATKERMAAIKKLRSLPIIREAKSQAAMDLYEAIVGVDLAITQAQFAGTGINDALRIQDDARAGAGLTTALAGITTNVAESLISTINDEVTQLIDVREALKEGKVGLADRLLRRLHEQAPLLRMATGSQVQLTMTSALPESLYKAARGLALRGADQPKQAFDSARVEIGGVTMLYAINPMVVHHNGSPAKAGTMANDFTLMRALLLEERNHRTQVMHDAVMQELEGTTSMAEVRSAVNRVMDRAVKGGSVSKEYADNMANALVGRLVDEMQRPANVRNLSVAVFAALQKRGHVDIKANRQRTRISFVSELDSNRRLDVTVRPQEVQIADNIRMQRIYVYRLDTSGIPAEDVETKRKLVAYAVKHIRDVHKINNAQPETEHKDAYAIELSPELMAEEAIYKDLIRKDSEAFMDLGFGQVIDPTSIKGNFKAMPKNKAELRRFMSDPFYDDMEGMRSGLPYNGRGTSGFEIPEMWDLDRMPKGADDDWSSTAFLLAYDEWLRQLNRESYDANLSMAEFHNAIEKFVDDEGVTGLQKWQRFDEINQAMLAAIDVYSWLTDGGWNYAKKLGYATNTTPRPTTFDGWIAFIEARKADQDRRLADGQKLREGEERLVGLGSDTRKILDIARKIHRGQGKWRALGFEEARLARVVVLPGREGAGYGEGFEGGLAAAMISKAAETTRRAWQGQLIRSKQDVYISLLWKDEEDRPMFEDANYGVQEPTAAGGPAKTGVGYRAKRRTILGYVHGSMMGRKLVRTGAVESWHRTTRNVNEALMNNAYIESLKAIGAIVKAPKTGVPGGYKRLEVKSIAGLQGYMAKEWIAKYLKNSLTQYGVKDIENPIYRNYMRLTIAAKHLMLMFGFFHHQAFLRSYLFTVRRSDAMPGGAKQMFRELGQIGLASGLSYLRAFGLVSQERLETVAQRFTPYRTGSQYIADRHVDLELGQQEGLTIQKGNEVVGGGMSGAAYDPDDKEAADQWVRKAFDRIAGWSMSEDRKQRAYQFVENFRRVQFETAAWLFNSMGANLKAAAYMSYFDELRMQNFERLQLDTDGSFLRSLARKAAMKTNADFGGLNLKAREGKASDIFGDGGPRDPKVQMALRALILAPDWTESNLVTVLNTVKTGNILGEPAEMERIEKNMYRHMWLRVGSRALAIQFIINMLLAGIDPDRDLYDLYEEAGFFGKVDDNTPKWSKFRWLDVNASLFSPTESRKFVSVFGHFGDPLKWTADFFNDSPIAPLDRKGSVAARMVVETITGADYSGRRFTTWREIMGIDYDAGVYQRKTTLKDGTVMMPGDSKAGKYAGKLSRFSTKTGAVSLEQVLGGGYLWTQLFKFMPLQGRAAIEFVTGQKDAFDFMMELTGTKYGRTYPK